MGGLTDAVVHLREGDEVQGLQCGDAFGLGSAPPDEVEEADDLVALARNKGVEHLLDGVVAERGVVEAHNLRAAHADR